MTVWNDIVLGSCFLLLVFLVWKEWAREDRRFRLVRVLATVLAVIALACLGLALTYMRPMEAKEKRVSKEGDPARLIFSMDWTRKLVKGEELRVQGRWAAGKTKLILTGIGSVLDSAEWRSSPATKKDTARTGKDTAEFSLHTIPAVIGRTVYHLMVVAAAGVPDTLEREDVPVEVVEGKALKILFLASSPDFENSFLINWLSKGGHGVASRTRISRGKYDKVYVHLPELSLETLSPSLLDRFDLVIADAGELAVLGAGEQSVLRREVREKGLGLIVKMDSAGKKGMAFNGEGIVLEEGGKKGVVLDGEGKLFYTLVDTTYSQVLAGKEKEYAMYWSRLLGKVARSAEPEERWRVEPGLPRVGEPVRIWLETNKDGLPQGDMGDRAVYLAQDARLPFYWQGSYWPETVGWQYVRSSQGDTCWWYAGAGGRGGPEVGGMDAAGKTDEVGGSRMERVAISKGWFYAIFFLCILFLWLERKYLL